MTEFVVWISNVLITGLVWVSIVALMGLMATGAVLLIVRALKKIRREY